MWTRRKKAGPARDVDASAGANLDPAAVRAIAIANAIDASMAVIQFTADGAIVDANDLFLATMGYARDDVVGRHHRMFVDPAHADSAEYRAFWRDLATGVPKSAEFERVGRDRRQLWIQATYSPIRGADGAVQGVVKVAADITSRKQRDLYNAAILTAVDRTQAMIEFEPDGTILNANRGFLDVMGFRLADVVGQHHRIFMPPDRVASPDYDDHWRMLAAGHAQQGEFERRNKAGEPVFIHATYTPIQDDRGRVVRIVKFATDMTAQVLARRSTAVAESIARSITELAASSAEINQRVADTASRSTHLAESSGGAKQLVADLDSASGEISHVVDFIRDLADQTNLLALNATIEAARAGDAGRGFHVVATEVKQLANATNEALARIRTQIEGIQSRISTVFEAIDGIASNSTQVGANSTSVAAAVEQQTTILAGLRDNAQTLLTARAGDVR